MGVSLEMRKRYISRRLEEIERIQSQLSYRDFSLAETVGHQIKGNAKIFDFPEIASIGLEMEQAARQRDERILRRCLGHLSNYFLGPEAVLDDHQTTVS